MKDLIAYANEKYKQGDFFLSATKRLTTPQIIVGTIRWSKIRRVIVCDSMGVLYDGDTDEWAEIIN